MSEDVKKRLAEMGKKFAENLPERIEEIEAAGQNFFSRKDVASLEHFRILVHKLAGSAATFGFDATTSAAKALESNIIFMLQSSDEITQGQVENAEDLLSRLTVIAGEEGKERPIKTAARKADSLTGGESLEKVKKKIYLLKGEGGIEDELENQLQFFGYRYELFSEPSLFFREWEVKDRCSGDCILVNVEWIARSPEHERLLKRFKNDHSQCTIIGISRRDDFQTRLKAVRAGTDAFYPLPLDMSRLIDRIDGIISGIAKEPYHVLIVDDDPEQVSFYALVLQQAGMITSVALDPKQVIKILVEAKPEIILMDMYMPECDGMELTSIIRQQSAFISIPIVFLSIETDMDKKLTALKNGADDFLTKPIRSSYLVRSISHRAERNRAIRFFMERDSLTGLLNHTNLIEQLNREIMRSMRTGAGICFAMLDIDHFKKVNDTYGHITGDRVLKGLARMLQDHLRATDIIGRYGGEEFGVILLNTSLENGVSLMDKLREEFAGTPHYCENKSFFVTFSCGVAAFPRYEKASAITEAADKALYSAKDQGRNRVLPAGINSSSG